MVRRATEQVVFDKVTPNIRSKKDVINILN
jgi:hypothetical protein